MEEIEPPTEHLHEHIQEGAEHGHTPWMMGVALSTAILAVLAAVASLLANHHSDEALLSQIQSNDAWNYYESKGIKSEILNSTNKILEQLGKGKILKDSLKIEANKKQQESIRNKAELLEKDSERHGKIHSIYARSVTLFQIAIAISAITILTKRKTLWFLSLVFSVLGLFFLIYPNVFNI
jgi:hypothetical protein